METVIFEPRLSKREGCSQRLVYPPNMEVAEEIAVRPTLVWAPKPMM